MRVICWFSCGAASAVAAKLALTKYPDAIVVYTEVKEEHNDNKRFLKDCEKWFGKGITILRNDKYDASVHNVARTRGFLKGPSGAACTYQLKKSVRKQFELPGDKQVFGFTVEEQDRFNRFLDANNIDAVAPLIENGLSKSDCLGMLKNAGIEIPAMYKMGYNNNNCIGCVKGGKGYWNKIRVDFPDKYEEMCKTEEIVGARVFNDVSLRDLPIDAGNYPTEQNIECSIFCYMAEQVYR